MRSNLSFTVPFPPYDQVGITLEREKGSEEGAEKLDNQIIIPT